MHMFRLGHHTFDCLQYPSKLGLDMGLDFQLAKCSIGKSVADENIRNVSTSALVCNVVLKKSYALLRSLVQESETISSIQTKSTIR